MGGIPADLDFYANPPGINGGRRYLGSTRVTSSGPFTVSLLGYSADGESITATATYLNNTSNFSNPAVTVAAPSTLHVTSVKINDGSPQRSQVNKIEVTFSTAVTFNAGAFELNRQFPAGTVALNVSGIGSNVTLTFVDGPIVSSGFLQDGLYTLRVKASEITSGLFDGNSDGITGDDYVLAGNPTFNSLYRFFGDFVDDGEVDRVDLRTFRLGFGLTGPNTYVFDFDHDGIVNAADLEELKIRLGTSIAPLVVTNVSDSGLGSLRDVLDCANERPGVDTINFQLPGTGPFTINLASALPTITDPIVIDGSTVPGNCSGDQIIIRRGSGNMRMFEVNIPAGVIQTATFSHVTIMRGLLTSGDGAGILIADEDVILERVRVTNNKTNSGRGGGIAVLGNGSLTLAGTKVDVNSALGSTAGLGGGIYNDADASIIITDSPAVGSCSQTFSDIFNNTAANSGGGIYNRDTGSITVEHNSKAAQ